MLSLLGKLNMKVLTKELLKMKNLMFSYTWTLKPS